MNFKRGAKSFNDFYIPNIWEIGIAILISGILAVGYRISLVNSFIIAFLFVFVSISIRKVIIYMKKK